MLLHVNAQGVPRPTANSETWCFSRDYTKYLPLALADILQWCGDPAVFVWDCSSAGTLVDAGRRLIEAKRAAAAEAARTEAAEAPKRPLGQGEPAKAAVAPTLMMGACRAGEALPTNPKLPADVFTACLTTPIRMALRWWAVMGQCVCLHVAAVLACCC